LTSWRLRHLQISTSPATAPSRMSTFDSTKIALPTNPRLKWTPFVGPRTVHIEVESRLPFLPSFFFFESSLSRFLLLFLLYCGYVGNGFALSKRSGISTGLAGSPVVGFLIGSPSRFRELL
jgi:hypothetical protein